MTETRQFVLIAVLAFLGFLIYQAWQEDYGQPSNPVAEVAATDSTSTKAIEADGLPAVPNPVSSTASDDDLPQPASVDAAVAATADDATPLSGNESLITVTTDVYELLINPRGGSIRQVKLLQYPLLKKNPDDPVVLLTQDPNYYFVAETGLQYKLDGGKAFLSDKNALYSSSESSFRMADGDRLEVTLSWVTADLNIEKVFSFTRGSYKIDVEHRVSSTTGKALNVFPFGRLERTQATAIPPPPLVQTHLGGAYYEQEGEGYKFTKLDMDEFVSEDTYRAAVLKGANTGRKWATSMLDTQQGGWVAMIQHHFLAAQIPPKGETLNFFTQQRLNSGNQAPHYAIGWQGQAVGVAAGEKAILNSAIFIGPKLQQQLTDTATGLAYTVDYGIFTIVSDGLWWVLKNLYKMVGNWGFAIILLTMLVKLLFYKPSEWQYRSMAKMRKFAPKIKALRARYGDDREKMNQAMMKLYKEEKFNPFGGCVPMLIQMPVFIALYWVLIESVELRQAPFIFWLNDLTAPDPYYVLPVLFGASMFLQQKLMSSNAMMDPMQQRIMTFMPIGLTIFFALFPSGLVLYWVANNIFSMAQQWWITRQVDMEDEGNKAKSKG